MDKMPVFKMIDFSSEDGELYLSIQYEENKPYELCLVNREDNEKRKIINGRNYGDYIEISQNIKDIFSENEVSKKEVWDIRVLKNEKEIEIDLGKHKKFMVDYFNYKSIPYKIKPYITADNTLAIFIKNK
ncbi:MAG: hypothetical protein ACRC7N_20915 [Clostridium sp.]